MTNTLNFLTINEESIYCFECFFLNQRLVALEVSDKWYCMYERCIFCGTQETEEYLSGHEVKELIPKLIKFFGELEQK